MGYNLGIMKLIITRHGETEENKIGKLQGHLPGKLSSLGIEQAKKVALRLKGEKIDYIYSSDLARAADTAKEIAKYHLDIPIEFTQELREKDLGELTGVNKDKLGVSKKDLITDVIQSKEGESHEQIVQRAESFYNKILKKHPDDTVLLVGHNGINKILISVITGQPKEEIPGQHNTGVNIFEIDTNKNCKILVFNNADHLNG